MDLGIRCLYRKSAGPIFSVRICVTRELFALATSVCIHGLWCFSGVICAAVGLRLDFLEHSVHIEFRSSPRRCWPVFRVSFPTSFSSPVAHGVQGRYEAVENLHRQALSSMEGMLGEEHSDTLSSVENLGQILQKQDQEAVTY